MKKRLKFLVWRFSCCLFFQTMEPVDQLLQCVDPTKDRETWVRENKTGEIRPVDIEIWYRRYLMNSYPDTASSRLRARGEEVCAGIIPLPRMHTLICMWFLTDWGTVSLCWAILYVLTAPLLTMISASEGVFWGMTRPVIVLCYTSCYSAQWMGTLCIFFSKGCLGEANV